SFEETDFRPALICDDVKGLDITGFRAEGTMESESLIKLKNAQDVFIHGCRPLNNVGLFMSVQGENSSGIELRANCLSHAKKDCETGSGTGEKSVRINGSFKK
ncbi:hypothetical protein KAS50_07720, partial [bacterium]|nr:hypothetical protein [bacterium]